jgi:dTDP-4-dehydrorhamnose 3,5-epimerase
MHFQRTPHEEVKLFCCSRGAIHDVLTDVRPDSPTFLNWEAYELTADNRRLLYVPAGLAHGFQTLTPDTEVTYLISAFYAPAAAAGLRYNDPAFAIPWPLPIAEISTKDRVWPDFVSPRGREIDMSSCGRSQSYEYSLFRVGDTSATNPVS